MRKFRKLIENSKDASSREYGVTAALIAAAAIYTMIAVAPDFAMVM